MPGVEVSAKLLKCGHVKFLDIGVVRNSPFGLLHAVGDSASKADDLDRLDSLQAGTRCRPRGHDRGTSPRSDVGVEVGMADAAGRSGSGNELQRNAKLMGTAP